MTKFLKASAKILAALFYLIGLCAIMAATAWAILLVIRQWVYLDEIPYLSLIAHAAGGAGFILVAFTCAQIGNKLTKYSKTKKT